ncbi:MAG TPA: PilN domain-containing protein [bacterium]|nr:PilN domain-containing protein [bacterium]
MAGSCWALAFAALGLGLLLVFNMIRLGKEVPDLQKAWALAQQTPEARPLEGSLVSTQEREALRRRLKKINGLDAGKGWAVPALLSRLERAMPPGVRLVSLQQDTILGQAQLVVESAHLEDLTRLLASLEKDQAFQEVELVKQAQAKDGEQGRIQFFLNLQEGTP